MFQEHQIVQTKTIKYLDDENTRAMPAKSRGTIVHCYPEQSQMYIVEFPRHGGNPLILDMTESELEIWED